MGIKLKNDALGWLVHSYALWFLYDTQSTDNENVVVRTTFHALSNHNRYFTHQPEFCTWIQYLNLTSEFSIWIQIVRLYDMVNYCRANKVVYIPKFSCYAQLVLMKNQRNSRRLTWMFLVFFCCNVLNSDYGSVQEIIIT